MRLSAEQKAAIKKAASSTKFSGRANFVPERPQKFTSPRLEPTYISTTDLIECQDALEARSDGLRDALLQRCPYESEFDLASKLKDLGIDRYHDVWKVGDAYYCIDDKVKGVFLPGFEVSDFEMTQLSCWSPTVEEVFQILSEHLGFWVFKVGQEVRGGPWEVRINRKIRGLGQPARWEAVARTRRTLRLASYSVLIAALAGDVKTQL